MPLDDAKSIRKHFDCLKGDRATWESLWQEVSDHGLARRSFNQGNWIPSGRGKRTRNIYDNTMMVANELLASGLHNILTPTATRWLHVEPEDPEVLESAEAADWFAAAEERLVRDIERYESGFHTAMSEVYPDIAAFGNGALATLWDGGLVYQSMPLTETYVEEDSYGRVNRIYRDFELTAAQVIEKFGEVNAPERARAAYYRGEITQRTRILQALVPNPAYSPSTKFGRNSLQITSWFIDYETSKEILRESFRELPIAFARWNKDSDELYGRGSGVQALSDQRMLNKMNWTTLRGAEKAIDPPMLLPDNGFVTQLDLSPGGYSFYRATTVDQIRELYTRSGEGVDLGVQLSDRRQTNIRAAYHYELLQLIQDPRMSATQVLEISARVQQILSPAAARLQSELLEPVVSRSFREELRHPGSLPPVPAILAGVNVRFRYVSPVQRAQRASEARAAVEAINATMQIGQLDPRAFDPIDTEALTRFFFAAYGVSPHLLRTSAEVKQLQQGRAQLQQQREQQSTIQGMAEAAGKAAPALQAIQGGKAA